MHSVLTDQWCKIIASFIKSQAKNKSLRVEA